jgi:CRP-like cAMP-binding protein
MRVYSTGMPLFQQGAEVNGIYLVESGQVRLLLPTVQSRLQLLEHAGPGTVLALSEAMSGARFRVTAIAVDYTTIAFIPRENFLDFLRDHGDFCMQIVRLLSEDLHTLYHKFRNISAHPGRPRQRQPDEQLN